MSHDGVDSGRGGAIRTETVKLVAVEEPEPRVGGGLFRTDPRKEFELLRQLIGHSVTASIGPGDFVTLHNGETTIVTDSDRAYTYLVTNHPQPLLWDWCWLGAEYREDFGPRLNRVYDLLEALHQILMLLQEDPHAYRTGYFEADEKSPRPGFAMSSEAGSWSYHLPEAEPRVSVHGQAEVLWARLRWEAIELPLHVDGAWTAIRSLCETRIHLHHWRAEHFVLLMQAKAEVAHAAKRRCSKIQILPCADALLATLAESRTSLFSKELHARFRRMYSSRQDIPTGRNKAEEGIAQLIDLNLVRRDPSQGGRLVVTDKGLDWLKSED